MISMPLTMALIDQKFFNPSIGLEPQVRNDRFGEVRSLVSTGLGFDPCLRTCA